MSDCAILAIASTTETVHSLLSRLIKDSVIDVRASDVPWTIVNKYYTAEVTFIVRSLSAWTAQDEVQAPALLFVWKRGEPYRDQIRRLAREVTARGFEVALAVRLPATGCEVEDEDDQDVDAYVSSEGFEFVDVADDGEACSLPDRSGIPGIPRIVDALSTIMWPSMCMIRQPSKGKGAMSDAIHKGTDDYHTLVRLVGERIGGGEERMKRELEDLERWLDESPSGEEEEGDGTPWSTVVTPGTLSPCSTGFLDTSRPSTPTLKTGFDDDFTCFVSAPDPATSVAPPLSVSSVSSTNRPRPLPARASTSFGFGSTFQFEGDSESGRSSPALDRARVMLGPGGETYTTLGSVSDLGLADEDGPSRAEIAETSRRIFGVPLMRSPVQERFGGDTADGDLEQFDLQSVLGALQGLKEEIAGMPDEERRKAAARVALGLAYGLGGEKLV